MVPFKGPTPIIHDLEVSDPVWLEENRELFYSFHKSSFINQYVTISGGVAMTAPTILSSTELELKVRLVIADSLCVELDEVQMTSNLVRNLGAESIDFLDIMFRLEKEFNIKIPQREIERAARGGLKPEEFEVDSIIQSKGLQRLKELLPEVNPEDFREGMSLREIPSVFTVAVFHGIVKRKLEGTLFEGIDAPIVAADVTTETSSI